MMPFASLSLVLHHIMVILIFDPDELPNHSSCVMLRMALLLLLLTILMLILLIPDH